MSTISNTTGDASSPENASKEVHTPAAPAVSSFGSMAREPLIHLLLIGALIFGIDYALHPPAKDDKVIHVTKALRQSFIENFDEDKERVPSEAELEKMIESWVASEILYREG